MRFATQSKRRLALSTNVSRSSNMREPLLLSTDPPTTRTRPFHLGSGRTGQHFRFWILDFRFIQTEVENPKSKIQNLKSKRSYQKQTRHAESARARNAFNTYLGSQRTC